MGRSLSELENQLERLKLREAKIREELVNSRKAADSRQRKEETRKKCLLADVFVDQFGQSVLNNCDIIAFFISEHAYELSKLLVEDEGYQE